MYNLSNNSSENRLFSWALASQPFMGDSSENVLFHTGWCTTYMTVYSEHGVFIVGGIASYMKVYSGFLATCDGSLLEYVDCAAAGCTIYILQNLRSAVGAEESSKEES